MSVRSTDAAQGDSPTVGGRRRLHTAWNKVRVVSSATALVAHKGRAACLNPSKSLTLANWAMMFPPKSVGRSAPACDGHPNPWGKGVWTHFFKSAFDILFRVARKASEAWQKNKSSWNTQHHGRQGHESRNKGRARPHSSQGMQLSQRLKTTKHTYCTAHER